MIVYNAARGIGDIYARLLRDLNEKGRHVIVRGQECVEFDEPVTLVYNQPQYNLMLIPGRKFNIFHMLAEVVWILSGNGNVEWISYFSKQMREYSDGGPDFHGAYGLRLRHWRNDSHLYIDDEVDQIQQVVKKLRRDPFSRQAVMSLWDPIRDNVVPSKDYPCNNWCGFRLRDGKLHQTVVIRSNDLVWGTPYNAVQFSNIQALVAGELGVEIGTLTYVIQNLHYYKNLYLETLEDLLAWAYDSERTRQWRAEAGLKHHIEPVAAAVPDFGPVTDAKIQSLNMLTESILLHAKAGVYDKIPDIRIRGVSSYWESVLPCMIWVFATIKEQQNSILKAAPDSAFVKGITGAIVLVGEPLLTMIRDFYSESKNPFARMVMSELEIALSV